MGFVNDIATILKPLTMNRSRYHYDKSFIVAYKISEC